MRGKKEEKLVLETGEVVNCPDHPDGHVVRFGVKVRADNTELQRYRCQTTVEGVKEEHTFSIDPGASSRPEFTTIACPTHRRNSRVAFADSTSKGGVNRQRYNCHPYGADEPHRFTPAVPRTRVENERNWQNADVVRNPNRGKPASGRGRTADIPTVVEGLRMLSQGRTYADVGRYAEGQGQTRKARTTKKRTGANFWQTGADWCELYSPVLWDAWLGELEKHPPAEGSPRIVVVDDLPFFGGKQTAAAGQHRKSIFSVLVAVEYFQPDINVLRLDSRVRLVRAFPKHTADAYELLVCELGYIPDVIVSDSSTSIEALLRRLRKKHPVVWIPSAFHVVKQLRKALAKMTSAKSGGLANAGDLLNRVESYQLLDSPADWREWWDDFDAKTRAQQVAAGLLPTVWRRKYQQAVDDALVYIDTHPNTPRGNGAVEATIRGAVKPFFEGRATTMGNINRTNNLCDLLCLAQNRKMDDPAAIATILMADLEDSDSGGFAPPARQIADPAGTRSLRDAGVVLSSLARAKKTQT